MNYDDVMTAEEVAAYLKCHPSTVYRLIKARTLPYFKIGSDYRFQKDRIQEWIAKRTQEVTPAATARLRAV